MVSPENKVVAEHVRLGHLSSPAVPREARTNRWTFPGQEGQKSGR